MKPPRTSLKNRNGFAVVLIMALLPCVLAGFLLCFSTVGFIQTDLALKYQCRSLGESTQDKVRPLLTALLALNPLAVQLRIELAQAMAEIAAAIATENPVALAKAKDHYNRVVQKRQELDYKQKQLINNSNRLLRQGHQFTRLQLGRLGATSSNVLLKMQLTSVRGEAPRLAVRPDVPDTAPIYNPLPDFETQQALAHEWQYRLQVQAPFSAFLKGSFTFKKACAVTLTEENALWRTKIIKGKFSLKSVW